MSPFLTRNHGTKGRRIKSLSLGPGQRVLSTSAVTLRPHRTPGLAPSGSQRELSFRGPRSGKGVLVRDQGRLSGGWFELRLGDRREEGSDVQLHKCFWAFSLQGFPGLGVPAAPSPSRPPPSLQHTLQSSRPAEALQGPAPSPSVNPRPASRA